MSDQNYIRVRFPGGGVDRERVHDAILLMGGEAIAKCYDGMFCFTDFDLDGYHLNTFSVLFKAFPEEDTTNA